MPDANEEVTEAVDGWLSALFAENEAKFPAETFSPEPEPEFDPDDPDLSFQELRAGVKALEKRRKALEETLADGDEVETARQADESRKSAERRRESKAVRKLSPALSAAGAIKPEAAARLWYRAKGFDGKMPHAIHLIRWIEANGFQVVDD